MIATIDSAVHYVRARTSLQPRAGVILGSGLGNVVDAIKIDTAIPYGDIPGARASTVMGHSGRMIFGHAGNLPVVVMQGRVHFYEGYEMEEVMFLSRVIGRLGIKTLVVTNAAGGVNTSYVGPESARYTPSFSVSPMRFATSLAFARSSSEYASVMSGKRTPSSSTFGPRNGLAPIKLM